MACGEGYGSAVLARSAASRRRRRRQPRGPRARAAALPRAEPDASSGGWSRPSASPARSTRSCSCRRSSTCSTRRPCSRTSAVAAGSGRHRLRLDPERADARAAGRREVRQPVAPPGVPGRRVPRLCARRVRRGRDARAVPRPQAARARARADARLGSRAPRAWGSPTAFYDRFTPAIATQRLRAAARRLDRALDFLAVCRTDPVH